VVIGTSALLVPSPVAGYFVVMLLPKRAIDELKALYKQHRNESLSDEEATAIASCLLRAYYLVTRPEGPGFPREDGGANSAPVDPLPKKPLR